MRWNNESVTPPRRWKKNRESPVAAEGTTPETEAIQQGAGRQLDKAIRALPAEFREVVILRELEEMSYRDIAAATGTPIGTVMSRLARGRALLKAELTGGEHGM